MSYGIISILRIPYNILVSSHGLFKQTYLQPVLSALLSLIICVVLGRYNWLFILVGPLIFYAFNFVYQHFRLKKLINNISFKLAVNNFLMVFIGFCFAVAASIFIPPNPGNYFSWVVVAVATVLISIVISLVIGFALNRQYLIETFKYLRNFIRSICNKKTGEGLL